MKQHFRPEFVNRIDDIVIFHSLKPEQIAQIVDIQLVRLQKLLSERKLTLTLTDGAKKFLAKHGFDPQYGARPLKRAIQKYVQDPLSSALLEAKYPEGTALMGDVKGDEIVFKRQ